MAQIIDHNTDTKFGGAVVIVPPENGGEAIELLILDNSSAPGQFWATLKTRCDMALDAINVVARQQGFGR